MDKKYIPLITAQSQEVQDIIAKRIDALRSNHKAALSASYRMYHTHEVINKRFDEFEQTMTSYDDDTLHYDALRYDDFVR